MEPFTASTLLTREDFTRCMLRQTYRKPYTIILTVAGVGIIILNLVSNYYRHSFNLFSLLPGFFILLLPALQVYVARKTTFNKPALQFPVDYTFSDDGIRIKGMTFESSFAWLHILKVTDDPDFLLLYTTKSVAYFIKRDSVTPQQIDFIRSKVKKR